MGRYDALEQYLRAAEPNSKEKAEIWQTAVGLQKVDGLNVSDFLIETAKRHIEGEIDINTVQQLVSGYYQSREARDTSDDDMEADTASSNIVKILSEPSFTFSVEGLISIHRKIFHNVFKHAGKFRDYDISKKEWVLDGASVLYGPATDLRQTIQYDFDQEKAFHYKGLDMSEIINHLASFISGIWQIHPFREGNTRATAVFTIKYLRSLGFNVENDMFKAHSWYFRNALVRANYRNVISGVEATPEYLILFLRNLLLGENNELRNRNLHIRWGDTTSSQESSQEKLLSSQQKVLNLLQSNPSITLQEVANTIGLTRRGVQKITDRLKADGIISRIGSTKSGKWILNNPT